LYEEEYQGKVREVIGSNHFRLL